MNRALVLSSSTFYCAFKSHERRIVEPTSYNEFSAGILPDALATRFSAQKSNWLEHRERVQEFASEHFGPRNVSIPNLWTLANSLSLSRNYSDVKYFAREFALGLSGNSVTGKPNDHPIILTALETDRIERAFYWFEFYCNVSRTGLVDYKEGRELFLDLFAPWEIEQLTTVYEHLYRRISIRMCLMIRILLQILTLIAFNDVAKHDVEWGENRIEWGNRERNRSYTYINHLLSLGLGYLRRLASAKTYEERYEMLAVEHKENYFFLQNTLWESPDNYQDLPLDDLTEEEEAIYIRAPLIKGSDVGPAEAWRWAHRGKTTGSMYACQDGYELRQGGYVMFEFDRLCQWNTFRKLLPQDDKDATIEKRNRDYCEMRKSWEQRSKVWQKGGRGYWSEGDQSRLVWPYRSVEKPKPAAPDVWGMKKPGWAEVQRYLKARQLA